MTISVAGGQANGITYIMDGGTHNDPFNNLNLPMPFPDALQEFKVETSALPARYGQHAASRRQRGHQVGHERVPRRRRSSSSATTTSTRATSSRRTRDSLKRNQFGGTVGGADRQGQAVLLRRLPGHASRRATRRRRSASCRRRRCWPATSPRSPSPACNGGTPVDADRRLRQQPHRSVAVQPGRAEHPQARPGLDRSLRQAAVRHPEQQHRAPGRSRKRRLHDQLEPVAVRALLLRGLRQPGDLRRQQRADAEPHRPEQPGALARRRPQLDPVVVDAQLAARDVQQDAQRPAAAAVLQRHRPRRRGLQPGARLRRASTSPATASRSATAAPIPATSTRTSFQIADDVDMVRGNHQFSIGGNWIHSRIETLNNRPTNGAFTFNGQGTGLSLADFMLGIVSGGFLQGNPVYDNDHSDYVGAYAQDNWRVRPNLTVNLGLRWEPFLPVQNTDSLGEPLRAVAVRSERAQHGLSAGAGRPDVPGRCGLSGRRRRRAARWRSSRRASAWSGRRTATSGRACARRGASSTTRRTCSSTPASRTTRRGARRSRSRIRPAASPIRISAIRAATRSRR